MSDVYDCCLLAGGQRQANNELEERDEGEQMKKNKDSSPSCSSFF
jgi:hypothetical protein